MRRLRFAAKNTGIIQIGSRTEFFGCDSAEFFSERAILVEGAWAISRATHGGLLVAPYLRAALGRMDAE